MNLYYVSSYNMDQTIAHKTYFMVKTWYEHLASKTSNSSAF